MKKILFYCLFACSTTVAMATPKQQVPCSANPVYRQFDFWLGEWEVYNLKGMRAGDSKVERLLDSCIILENWTGRQGGYAGKSYNTFNAATGKWQQYWVDNKGGIVEFFDGRFENGKMIMQTYHQKQTDGSSKITRMSFSKMGEDKVRQFGESSVDGGTTWKADFDLEYRRKK